MFKGSNFSSVIVILHKSRSNADVSVCSDSDLMSDVLTICASAMAHLDRLVKFSYDRI